MSQLESHLGAQIPWRLDRGKKIPDHFGNPETELATLKTAAAIIDLSHCELLSITGQEQTDFLGGLITNQVRNVTESQSVYAAHLTPQGRFGWDFTMVRLENRLLLITEPGEAQPLAQRLNLFRLRSKVVIEPVDAWSMLAIVGPDATSALQKLFPALLLTDAPLGATFAPKEAMRLWRDPRHTDFGWRLLVPVDQLPNWWDNLNLLNTIPPAGFSAWENYRILQGLPRGGNEFIPDVSLPLESGLLEMHGVDFTKGCYIGQETTTRTHHRGTLKKRVFSLMLSKEDAIVPGMAILLPDGTKTGVLTSITTGLLEPVGLGIIHLADVIKEQPLTIGTQRVKAYKPDWASW